MKAESVISSDDSSKTVLIQNRNRSNSQFICQNPNEMTSTDKIKKWLGDSASGESINVLLLDRSNSLSPKRKHESDLKATDSVVKKQRQESHTNTINLTKSRSDKNQNKVFDYKNHKMTKSMMEMHSSITKFSETIKKNQHEKNEKTGKPTKRSKVNKTVNTEEKRLLYLDTVETTAKQNTNISSKPRRNSSLSVCYSTVTGSIDVDSSTAITQINNNQLVEKNTESPPTTIISKTDAYEEMELIHILESPSEVLEDIVDDCQRNIFNSPCKQSTEVIDITDSNEILMKISDEVIEIGSDDDEISPNPIAPLNSYMDEIINDEQFSNLKTFVKSEPNIFNTEVCEDNDMNIDTTVENDSKNYNYNLDDKRNVTVIVEPKFSPIKKQQSNKTQNEQENIVSPKTTFMYEDNGNKDLWEILNTNDTEELVHVFYLYCLWQNLLTISFTFTEMLETNLPKNLNNKIYCYFTRELKNSMVQNSYERFEQSIKSYLDYTEEFKMLLIDAFYKKCELMCNKSNTPMITRSEKWVEKIIEICTELSTERNRLNLNENTFNDEETIFETLTENCDVIEQVFSTFVDRANSPIPETEFFKETSDITEPQASTTNSNKVSDDTCEKQSSIDKESILDCTNVQTTNIEITNELPNSISQLNLSTDSNPPKISNKNEPTQQVVPFDNRKGSTQQVVPFDSCVPTYRADLPPSNYYRPQCGGQNSTNNVMLKSLLNKSVTTSNTIVPNVLTFTENAQRQYYNDILPNQVQTNLQSFLQPNIIRPNTRVPNQISIGYDNKSMSANNINRYYAPSNYLPNMGSNSSAINYQSGYPYTNVVNQSNISAASYQKQYQTSIQMPYNYKPVSSEQSSISNPTLYSDSSFKPVMSKRNEMSLNATSTLTSFPHRSSISSSSMQVPYNCIPISSSQNSISNSTTTNSDSSFKPVISKRNEMSLNAASTLPSYPNRSSNTNHQQILIIGQHKANSTAPPGYSQTQPSSFNHQQNYQQVANSVTINYQQQPNVSNDFVNLNNNQQIRRHNTNAQFVNSIETNRVGNQNNNYQQSAIALNNQQQPISYSFENHLPLNNQYNYQQPKIISNYQKPILPQNLANSTGHQQLYQNLQRYQLAENSNTVPTNSVNSVNNKRVNRNNTSVETANPFETQLPSNENKQKIYQKRKGLNINCQQITSTGSSETQTVSEAAARISPDSQTVLESENKIFNPYLNSVVKSFVVESIREVLPQILRNEIKQAREARQIANQGQSQDPHQSNQRN